VQIRAKGFDFGLLRKEMENELRAIVAHLENCWNRSDSVGFAEVFAEDADFVHILGGYYVGRDQVEAGHRIIFDTIYKNSVVKWDVAKIRPLGSDAAVVLTVSELEFQQGGNKVTLQTRPTMIAERREGKWQVAAFQNTLIKDANAGAVQERLASDHPFKGTPPRSVGSGS
jgi:uncharacterized protein (TIGR02246 family)